MSREIDALVAEHVMEASAYEISLIRKDERALRRYSTDIGEAWRVVRVVQQRQPGWRFDLVGGDVSYGYRRRRDGRIDQRGPDKGTLVAFGWHARFFGHINPFSDSGDAHGGAYAETAPLAICLAALKACGIDPDSALTDSSHTEDK
jgi:hypothetical protein